MKEPLDELALMEAEFGIVDAPNMVVRVNGRVFDPGPLHGKPIWMALVEAAITFGVVPSVGEQGQSERSRVFGQMQSLSVTEQARCVTFHAEF
jgi:hypothetical protein